MFSSIIFIYEAQSSSVPALYVFGDSLVDVGNNNYINSSSYKSNFPHNGIDFPTGATGRFSNGKNAADFVGNYYYKYLLAMFKNYLIVIFFRVLQTQFFLTYINYQKT